MNICKHSIMETVISHEGYLELRDETLALKVDNSRPIFDSVKLLLPLTLGVLELKY